jgi:hypothetical protein
MHLAILVVYLLENEADAPLIEIHQQFIQRFTQPDGYTIYAAANRMPEHLRRRLAGYPRMCLVDVPATAARDSSEHAYYLDRLAEEAIAKGATHLCSMDPDAFPIRHGWVKDFQRHLQAGYTLVAVCRHENGDSVLPHPACLFFDRLFYLRHQPRFLPCPADMQADQATLYRTFLDRSRQVPDTGIGFGFILDLHRLPWRQLLRSNRVNDHHLLAGIYDDTIFHLSSLARARKTFRIDRRWYFSEPALGLIRRCLRAEAATGLAERLLFRRTAAANEAVYRQIRGRLLEDPIGYLNYLRFGTSP